MTLFGKILYMRYMIRGSSLYCVFILVAKSQTNYVFDIKTKKNQKMHSYMEDRKLPCVAGAPATKDPLLHGSFGPSLVPVLPIITNGTRWPKTEATHQTGTDLIICQSLLFYMKGPPTLALHPCQTPHHKVCLQMLEVYFSLKIEKKYIF